VGDDHKDPTLSAPAGRPLNRYSRFTYSLDGFIHTFSSPQRSPVSIGALTASEPFPRLSGIVVTEQQQQRQGQLRVGVAVVDDAVHIVCAADEASDPVHELPQKMAPNVGRSSGV
jgi:hypothetical protein